MAAPSELLQRLRRLVGARDGLLVAYSGGVDSALLAKVAHEELGERGVACLVDSESLPRREREDAERFAAEEGLPLVVVEHAELADPRYVANDAQRCYFCREGMSGVLLAEAERRGLSTVAVGTNASDLGEWRPGQRALREAGVWSPLLEIRATKADVRAMARALGLTVADRPSMACLSSRIPYGTAVTEERLRLIEAAEEVVRRAGFRQVRVRLVGTTARVEVDGDEVDRLVARLPGISGALLELGFEHVEMDPEGYASGKLVPVHLKGRDP